ncbi:MAG TPA: VIT domain-containing protein [Rhizomicrobium sp.]|jgi:hypothetical protein|nr:VIT domain-containing protein [Rhizomicrobium sp.]
MHGDRTNLATLFRALVFAAATVAAASPALAAPRQNPELMAHSEDDDEDAVKSSALSIGKLDIDVAIIGDTARTVVTANFLNAGPAMLEGNFVFDMPPGSVVTGYGLDIDGKIVDGVLTGQRAARLTFESRERHNIDPGLAEVTRSGAFMTRVYPILAGKGRIVRLEFVTPIAPGTPFALPLQTIKPVGAVSIHIHDDAADAPPLRAPDGIALSWTHDATGYDASGSAENLVLSGALEAGPDAAPKPLQLGVHRSGETFFEVSGILPAPQGGAVPGGGHLRIYWDTSLSRRTADLAAEIALAGHYVATRRPAAVDLVFFSASGTQIRSFAAPGAAPIMAALRTADYQGGTSFQALLETGGADTCLLFSDGNVTVDSYRARQLPCRLFAVSSAPDANRALLATFAAKSGGDYADLTADTPETAARRLLTPGPHVVAVTDATGHVLDFAALPAGGDHFRVVGPAPAVGGIVVSVARQGVPTRRFAFDRVAAVPNDAPAALWAERKLGEMNATDQPDQAAMLALSRRYSVAGATTAFVVFENIDDYITAGVALPAAFGDAALAEFHRDKAQQDADAAREQANRLSTIIAMWTAEKVWWKAKFTPAVLEHRSPKGPASSSPMSVPPPPPPSPRAAAPSGGGGSGVESVVVTASVRPRGPSIAVSIAPWNPDRPYIKALTAARPADYLRVYRAQEKQFGTLPAFYLDTAEFLFRHGHAQDAIRIVLNALELPSAGTPTMTIVADRLMRYGDETRALWLYEHIEYLESDRPQPRRNLALALVTRAAHGGESPAAQRRDYARALDLLSYVVMHDWQEAFDGIEIISLMEANNIVPRLRALGVTKVPLDPRLIDHLDVDLRILLEWNTDETDMDLWVDEPNGERAIYSHPNTSSGGRLSNDMTNGYGPEEYLLHRAPDGAYTVRVNVFRADRLNPNGATTVRAHIFRNYGRANQREQMLELELKRSDDGPSVIGTIQVRQNGGE